MHAQEWADKLMAENLFQHRPGQKYGENIYSSWSSTRAKIRGGDAVDSWYKEIEQHTFGEEARSMNTGHFTQVVWAASLRLGVGLAEKARLSLWQTMIHQVILGAGMWRMFPHLFSMPL